MGILETCLPQHLALRCGGLRLTGATFAAVATASFLIRPMIIIIIIFLPHGSIIGIDEGS
jgi:hypothetical protein